MYLCSYNGYIAKSNDYGLTWNIYSTGFEIECSCKEDVNFKAFRNIPNIIEADVNTCNEQRFRIPNGIEGLQCLFNISIVLKKEALLNPGSGIHYHIDCTDYYDEIVKLVDLKIPSFDHFEVVTGLRTKARKRTPLLKHYSNFLEKNTELWHFSGLYKNAYTTSFYLSFCELKKEILL